MTAGNQSARTSACSQSSWHLHVFRRVRALSCVLNQPKHGVPCTACIRFRMCHAPDP